MTRKRDKYVVRGDSDLKLSEGMIDLIRRRTRPFLDGPGLDRPITKLLQEVYLQGITDAVDAMDHRQARGETLPPTEP